MINVDAESDYEFGFPPTAFFTPEEILSIESLIKKTEEFQRRD
jgi:hypothetical protein